MGTKTLVRSEKMTSRKSSRSESAVSASSRGKIIADKPQKSKKAVEKKQAKLHRCSFLPYQPAPIGQIACSPKHTLPQVAVLRKAEPPCIEIYTPSNDWSCDRVIPGRSGDDFECICMVGPSLADSDSEESDKEHSVADAKAPVIGKPSSEKLNIKHLAQIGSLKRPQARLFSAGVDGRIREWNIKDGCRQEIFSLDVIGGAIWCLAVSPDQETIAVGSEDGRVRLFSVLPRSLEFLRGFESGEDGRVLSLSWSTDGSRIVAGSAGGMIKVFDSRTGRVNFSIRAERKNKSEVTSVWSVAFVSDEFFATGDSTGKVQFWDAMTGVQQQSFPAFGADVLSLAVVSERQVFATGVDHKIVEFSLVKTPNAAGIITEKWIHGGKRYYHTHDVRSLAPLDLVYSDPKTGQLVCKSILMSGGVDCSLVASDPAAFCKAIEDKTFNSHQRRLLPFSRHSSLVKIACDGERTFLAGQLRNIIQVWTISGSTTQHLATVNISRYESVTSFALSPNGQVLCILNQSEWKLFLLPDMNEMTDEEPKVEKIEQVPQFKLSKNASAPHLCHFTDDDTLLLINSHEIVRISLVDMSLVDVTLLPSAPEYLRLVTSSRNGKYLALSSASSTFIFSVGKDIELVNTVKLDYAITAAEFTSETVLTLADCRNAVYTVSATSGKIVSETLSELCSDWKLRREPIIGISAHPSASGKISCWTESCISQLTLPEKTAKGRKEDVESRLVKDYCPLIFFSHLPSGDSVVVERPWISIVENFPPAFYRNRYGAQ